MLSFPILCALEGEQKLVPNGFIPEICMPVDRKITKWSFAKTLHTASIFSEGFGRGTAGSSFRCYWNPRSSQPTIILIKNPDSPVH